jgi:hypothetical protein
MKTDTETPIPAAFLDVFRDLVRAYQPRTVDGHTPRVYWETLGKYPVEILRAAALELRQRSVFFPTAPEWARAASRAAAPRVHGCVLCADAGLMRVEYRSGEPFDVAICACRIGQAYRTMGETGIRLRFNLADDHRIGDLEAFDEDV